MNTIKKILLLAVITTSNLQLQTFNCHAQFVALPDSNFANWLYFNGFNTCLNSSKMLDTTNALVLQAQTIKCDSSNIHDLTGIQYFKSLDTLICSFDTLLFLPQLPSTIQYLDCSWNPINSIPALPSSLTWFNCSDDMLSALPTLPSSLAWFYCYEDLFTRLPALPASLMYLNCSYNDLTGLPTLPASLKVLICNTDSLSNLPTLPASLNALYCIDNYLTSLPTLPASLISLNCGNNQIQVISTLPNSLVSLFCGLNSIYNLPALPASLDTLDCDNQQRLTVLPDLPSSLIYLDCSNNPITIMPTLGPSLRFLDCSSNLLQSLPTLPDSMFEVDVSDNINFACLPPINKINFLFFTTTNIVCAPDYGHVGTSVPPLDSLPLCYMHDANPYGCTLNSIQMLAVNGEQLTVFPNPAHDVVNVFLFNPAVLRENGCVMNVIDVTGRNMMQQVLTNQQTTIDLSGLSAGVYFIRVSTAEKTQTVKVVKD